MNNKLKVLNKKKLLVADGQKHIRNQLTVSVLTVSLKNSSVKLKIKEQKRSVIVKEIKKEENQHEKENKFNLS